MASAVPSADGHIVFGIRCQRDAVIEDLFSENGLDLNIFRGEIFPSYGNQLQEILNSRWIVILCCSPMILL